MRPNSVIRGETTQSVDYDAPEITFGSMRYVAIDMGDLGPTSSSLRTAMRTPAMEENIHRVLLHMALDLERVGQKCPKRTPNKSRVNNYRIN